MTQDITLWIKKVLVLILILGILYLLYSTAAILLIIIISGFVTILLNPLIERWEKHHIPAWITVLWVYVVIFILGMVVIGNLIPIVVDYISSIIRLVIEWVNNAQSIYMTQWGLSGFHLHPYIERWVLFLFGEENINHTLDIIKQNAGSIQEFLTNQISSLTSWGISVVSTVGWVVTDWALIAVTIFLMVIERKEIGNFILKISPRKMSGYLHTHYTQVQHVGTAWIRAIIILCFSIFSMTYIGLLLIQFVFWFQINQAFVLAIISGIMEFIPYAGPIISLILGVIIWLGISWKAALIIAILYIIVQQIEGNFLVPYVMSKSLDLSPFLVFMVMLVWATLGGILGIVVAVPVAGVCRVIYSEYMKNREDGILSEPEIVPNITKKPTKSAK